MIKAGDKIVCLYDGTWGSPANKEIPGPKKGDICHVEDTVCRSGRLGVLLRGYLNYGYYAVVDKAGFKYFEKLIEDYSSASNEVSKKLAKEVKEQEKKREIERTPEVV